MTEREQQIYAAISEYTNQKGYPPSVRELGAMVGIASTCTMHHYLHRIKGQGLITFEPSKPRTLRLLK
ncbi:transcriptional regulator [Pelotomaculum schinkii]|uniref:LexA family protein n=1 Tax=Pelotomaculum schinkii TaxID=78350 RepID=UPI00167DEE63